MILLFSILFYFLSKKFSLSLWLILPLSLFMDIWNLEPLGKNGMVIMLVIGAFWFVFGTRVKESYKLKI